MGLTPMGTTINYMSFRLLFTSDSEYIHSVFTHPHFPKRKADLISVAYVMELEVRIDFNTMDNVPMYHYFYINEPQGWEKQLVWGTRFN